MNLKEYYEKDYVDRMNMDYREQYAQRMLRLIHKWKPVDAWKSPRMLELGCFDGTLLFLAKQKGYEVAGIDIIQYTSDIMKKALNIKIGEITDLKQFKNQKFDVIVALDIIEHVRTPAETLDACHKLLKNDGVLVLSVPNSETLINPSAIIAKEHLSYFNYVTMYSLLKRCGFRIEWLKSRFFTILLFKLFRKKKGITRKVCNPYQPNKILDTLYDFIERLDVTDYGQDLMIVAKKKWKK